MTVSSHREPNNHSIIAHRHPNNPHPAVASGTPQYLTHHVTRHPSNPCAHVSWAPGWLSPQEVPNLPAVVPGPAGPPAVQGRGDHESACRTVAQYPPLVGEPGEAPRPRPLPGAHEELQPPRWVAPSYRTPDHTHVLAHGAGFGFKWRNGTGRIRGRYSLPHMGTRVWTPLGMLLCPPQGVRM